MSFRSALAGATVTIALGAIALAAFSWSTATGTAVGPLVRIFDALSPWLLAVGGAFAGAALLLGARWLGATLLLIAVLCGAVGYASYRSVTVPLADRVPEDFSVLFFNVENTNTAYASRIIEATVAEKPDIAVFAEAGALAGEIEKLEAAYSFVTPCTSRDCQLVLATDLPVLRSWFLSLNPIWPGRYGVMEIETPAGTPMFVVANHLTKPWMSGVSEMELHQLLAQYRWLQGPALVVGDFNMPPWSYPLRQILDESGFRALRAQPASWPASGGPFALPIDLALVTGGVQATGVDPFGQGLNSNHLGFVVDVAVPAPDG
ncbi:endonuclease/exonuclease/phosphatase family protein [Tropicimonas sp. S265A]|uniref:endonuclease/exonuclease/phosphatase family protein n=1 Tax=Tropicimonas sp. S265A TaxID=3415134 RepID=UPI003C7D47EC